MPEDSIESFLAQNVSKVVDKEFYAIGLGSNFFHQFTDAAVPLEPQLTHLQTKITDTSSSAFKKMSADCIRNIDMVLESRADVGIDMKNKEIPNAFIFPLRLLDEDEERGMKKKTSNIMLPDRFDSIQTTIKNRLSAPQRIRKLMQWRRISKRGKDKSKHKDMQNFTSDADETDLDYSNDKAKHLLRMSAGTTHNAMLVDGNIFITGTLHGKVYEKPTIQRPKHKLKCTQLSCGKRHLLALFQNKTVMSMGSGYFGQLGLGMDKVYCNELTLVERLSPRFVQGEVVSIEAGGMHSGAIVTKDVSSWYNRRTLKEIETKVYCWGSNKCGECAIDNGKGNSVVFFPTPMVNVRHPETGKKVSLVKLSWGKLHCVGLSHQGHVYSWGISGRCGHGELNVKGQIRKSALKSKNGASTTLPRRIEALRKSKIIHISAGDAHTLALSESGRVFSWGSNSYGQLGFGHTLQILSPRFVADLQFGLSTKGVRSTKEALIEEAEHLSQQSNLKESHPSSSSTTSVADVPSKTSSIDIATTIGDIHYPSTPQKNYLKKLQSQSSNAQNETTPFITTIYATGSYSAAVSSSGDLYTWGCSCGDQLGHNSLTSKTGNQIAEATPIFQTKSSLRIQDSSSFDSKFNVLIPKRVEWLRQLGLKILTVEASPTFMMLMCSKLETNDNLHIGRTLFEREQRKQSSGMDRIRLIRASGPGPTS